MFFTLAAVAGVFGLCEGNSHALMITLPQAMAGYALGFVMSSIALMLVGGLLGLVLRRLSPRMAATV
jgi:hydrogenase/urease accessory protein HupE